MSIKNIYNKNVVTITQDELITLAANKMYQHHVGAVIVVDSQNGSQRPIGIITDRDIVMALNDNFWPDVPLRVKEVMSPNVIMASENDGIYETINKMKENGIRRIPVTDQNKNLVGLIAADDLMKLLAQELQDLSNIVGREVENEMGVSVDVGRGKELGPLAS